MSFSLCENVHSCKVPFFGGSGSVTERADVSLLVVKQIHLIVVVVDVVGHVDLSLIRVVSNSVAPLLNANSAGSCHFPRANIMKLRVLLELIFTLLPLGDALNFGFTSLRTCDRNDHCGLR